MIDGVGPVAVAAFSEGAGVAVSPFVLLALLTAKWAFALSPRALYVAGAVAGPIWGIPGMLVAEAAPEVVATFFGAAAGGVLAAGVITYIVMPVVRLLFWMVQTAGELVRYAAFRMLSTFQGTGDSPETRR